MQPRSVLSAVLSLLVASATLGCVNGWNAGRERSCMSANNRDYRTGEHRDSAITRTEHCLDWKASGTHCGIRTFLQLQCARLQRLDLPALPRQINEKVPPSRSAALALASIGSPETDRGPPLS